VTGHVRIREVGALDQPKVRLFTPDEVLRMVEVGVLGEDEPVELVEGRLVVVSPQGPIHSSMVGALANRLAAAYGPGFTVREDKPLQLVDGLPEPDVAVVRGGQRDYLARHPVPADVLLVLEVAVTSQKLDRKKARSYARGGVATLWLLDVTARRLEVRSDPQPDGRYRTVQILSETDEVSPPGLAQRWSVRELLP